MSERPPCSPSDSEACTWSLNDVLAKPCAICSSQLCHYGFFLIAGPHGKERLKHIPIPIIIVCGEQSSLKLGGEKKKHSLSSLFGNELGLRSLEMKVNGLIYWRRKKTRRDLNIPPHSFMTTDIIHKNRGLKKQGYSIFKTWMDKQKREYSI